MVPPPAAPTSTQKRVFVNPYAKTKSSASSKGSNSRTPSLTTSTGQSVATVTPAKKKEQPKQKPHPAPVSSKQQNAPKRKEGTKPSVTSGVAISPPVKQATVGAHVTKNSAKNLKATNTMTSPSGRSAAMMGATSKKGGSLKQQLKQQIASLKRQKHMSKLKAQEDIRRQQQLQRQKEQEEAMARIAKQRQQEQQMQQQQAEIEWKRKQRQEALRVKELQRLRQACQQNQHRQQTQEKMQRTQQQEKPNHSINLLRQKSSKPPAVPVTNTPMEICQADAQKQSPKQVSSATTATSTPGPTLVMKSPMPVQPGAAAMPFPHQTHPSLPTASENPSLLGGGVVPPFYLAQAAMGYQQHHQPGYMGPMMGFNMMPPGMMYPPPTTNQMLLPMPPMIPNPMAMIMAQQQARLAAMQRQQELHAASTRMTSSTRTSSPNQNVSWLSDAVVEYSPYYHKMKDSSRLLDVMVLRPSSSAPFGIQLKVLSTSLLVDPGQLAVSKSSPSSIVANPLVISTSTSIATPAMVTKKAEEAHQQNAIPTTEKPPETIVNMTDETAKMQTVASAASTEKKPVVPGNPVDGSSSARNDQAIPMETGNVAQRTTLTAGVSADTNSMVTLPSRPPQKARRQRRRRIQFHVMAVVDAVKQNSMMDEAQQQHPSSTDDKERLLPGDIIASIGQVRVAGMSFSEACTLFGKNGTTKQDGSMQNTVQVIRRRAPPPSRPAPGPTNHLPSVVNKAASPAPLVKMALENTSPHFSTIELGMLADSMLQAIHNPARALGLPVSGNHLRHASAVFRHVSVWNDCPLDLSHRSTERLQTKWSEVVTTIEQSMTMKSREAWQKSGPNDSGFSSASERALLRQRPRPVQGCRCGKLDHEYLHDPKCSLYLDLKSRLSAEELSLLLLNSSVMKSPTKILQKKELNAMERGVGERFVKLKAVTELEAAEARFVARMEEMQVGECKQAIFAPSLATMVLSAIFELEREFPVDRSFRGNDSDEEDDDEEDDDDEEIALHELGQKRKRSQSTHNTPPAKKKTSLGDHRISFKFVSRMIRYISKTWGHVYREPSHAEYAWRWEVFHGHNSEDVKWESNSRNPRQPNALSFEHILHVNFDSNVNLGAVSSDVDTIEAAASLHWQRSCQGHENQQVASLGSTPDDNKVVPPAMTSAPSSTATSMEVKTLQSPEAVEQFCLAAHLLSPASSGIYDEVMALVQSDIVEIRKSGIPLLVSDWTTKADYLLLEDMDARWGSTNDPDGRYGVHPDLRDALEEAWRKSDFGWALHENRKDIIYEYNILDEWRVTFEGQMEAKANEKEGIGRFGL